MNRSRFLALFGLLPLAAKGQVFCSTSDATAECLKKIAGGTGTVTPVEWPQERNRLKPKNGECPVCGTMAKPYHRFVSTRHGSEVGSAIIRCLHCNAAFWQDAE